jgi:hypothetical protein
MTKTRKITAAVSTLLLLIGASVWWFSTSHSTREIVVAPVAGVAR